MNVNKQVAKSLEREHIKHVRHFYRSIADINLELAKIHKEIELHIDKTAYRYISDYVNQYVSYTSIWNLKFVYNMESPEIALLQLFHLEYIFDHESANLFTKERRIYTEQTELFNKLKPYKEDHIQLRKKQMMDYIQDGEKKQIEQKE